MNGIFFLSRIDKPWIRPEYVKVGWYSEVYYKTGQVLQLKKICGKFLSKSITIDNVSIMWHVANLYEVENLANAVIGFMVEHWPLLSKAYSIQELCKAYPKLLYTMSIMSKVSEDFEKSYDSNNCNENEDYIKIHNISKIWNIASLHKLDVTESLLNFMAAYCTELCERADFRELCKLNPEVAKRIYHIRMKNYE